MEGRRGATRRRRRERRSRRTGLVLVLATLVAVAIGSVAAVAVAGFVAARDYYDGLVDVDELEQPRLAQNSVLFSRDGSRLQTIANSENRQIVPLRRISKWLPAATVAIEDRRFYLHDGVDWRAVGRAAVRNLEAGQIEEGGSTLTQQLVRNLYPQITREVSLKRKLNEALVAQQLEERYSKEWILEQYLNTVPYGHSAYGAEAAAETYFSKDAADLSVSEAALLAGLPQAPSRFDPFVNPQAALARRNEVLRAMRDTGAITDEQYAKAVARKLGLKRGRLFGATRVPYFEQYVRTVLENDDEIGAEAVRSGGLRVRTTIDLRLQKLAFAAMRQVLPKRVCPKAPRADCDPGAALVAIRPSTGEILAMASTSNYKQTQFNLAQGQRQPGSTFKTFTLAAAIEAGINPATTYYRSAPFEIRRDDQWGAIYGPWKVKSGGYVGRSNLVSATTRSDNTVYAQLILDVGPEEVLDVARRLGVREAPLQPIPSLTLGSRAVSPLELTSAYATLAAGGVYRRPRAISRIEFAGSDRVEQYRSKGQRVMADGVAAEVTKILGQNMTGGTGRNARTSDGRPQAGKTGTTEDIADAWFCGYTPDLATCVWIGYPISEQYPLRNVEGVSQVFGGTLPSDIWHLFMDGALARTPPKDFAAPKTEPTYIPNFRSEFTERAVEIVPPAAKEEGKDGNDKRRDGGAAGGGAAGGGAAGGGE